jgi:hypothetical protein
MMSSLQTLQLLRYAGKSYDGQPSAKFDPARFSAEEFPTALSAGQQVLCRIDALYEALHDPSNMLKGDKG